MVHGSASIRGLNALVPKIAVLLLMLRGGTSASLLDLRRSMSLLLNAGKGQSGFPGESRAGQRRAR